MKPQKETNPRKIEKPFFLASVIASHIDDPFPPPQPVSDDLSNFVRAVQGADQLPSEVRGAAVSLDFVSRSTFDQSYLDFLQEQADDAANAPEWTSRVKARLAALTPYRDKPTLMGFIPTEGGLWSVRVDPARQAVIHGEFAS
jgi:hypothetical protein